MKIENIITQKFINDTIRPSSAEDGVFEGALFEAMMFDIKPRIAEDLYAKLVDNSEEDDVQQILDGGLRTAIGYYVLSRMFRTASATVTRYGVTVKSNDTSEPAYQNQINSMSNYYRTCGDEIMASIADTVKPAELKGRWYKARIVGD